MLYVLCGPSKSGKTTVMNGVLAVKPDLFRLVTLTTRPPRAGEVDGVDYDFVSHVQYVALRDQGHIFQPITYRGELYGIPYQRLHSCAERDSIGVLRPDILPDLAVHVPVVGIYITMAETPPPYTPNDESIYDNAHYCTYHILNWPGRIDEAVASVLEIMARTTAAANATLGGRS